MRLRDVAQTVIRSKSGIVWPVAGLLFVVVISPALGQELSILGGMMEDDGTRDKSYAWQLEYKAGRGEYFAYSLSYLNEGHIPQHHRDGHAAQLWVRTNIFDRRLSLTAGAGPFYYYDTLEAPAGTSHYNDHGWGGLFSAAAVWHAADRWFFQLRTNIVETSGSLDTASAVVGIGYQLEAPPERGPATHTVPRRRQSARNEITVSLGRTIVNSFDSESAVARSIEYRRRLGRAVDWSVSWLNEGKNRVIDRNGIITQLWAVETAFDDRLGIGIGGGVYLGVDRYRHPGLTPSENRHLSGIVTLTSSYQAHDHWGVRISWMRAATNYNRDSDVIIAGLSSLF